MKSKVTLKDVAQKAGVSYQTVSKVLRNQIKVTEDTRNRIFEAVAELGYRTNTAARSLRTQSSYLIGYSFKPDNHAEPNPILESFLQSIVRTAETYNYHIMLFPWQSSSSLSADYQELVTSNRVDGFVLSDIGFDDERIPVLQELNFPFVAFGRTESEPDYSYVDVDGRNGTYQAVNHLYEVGHQKIAVLAWPDSSRVGVSRLSGYYDALAEKGIPVVDDLVRKGEGSAEAAYQHMQALMELPAQIRPTAVVTMSDLMASGAIYAAQDRGMRIGREFGVVGFDDTPIARCIRPHLTTLRQPVVQVGKFVIDALIETISQKKGTVKQKLIAPELIVRDSTTKDY